MTSPWWETAFARDYQEIYAHRDDRLAETEIAGLVPRLHHAPGPVLDACCGNGRHLDALRASGIPAMGFDLSPHLLTTAAQRVRCRGRLARGDVRRPPLTSGWGAVLLLFTSFGYFDAEGNAACLHALAGLLAPGGWLLIDLPEPDHLRRNLVAESTRRTPSGLEIDERRRVVGERIEKTVTLRRAGEEPRSYTESVQLFSAESLAGMAHGSGLRVAETWPGLRGAAEDDHRLVHWLTTMY